MANKYTGYIPDKYRDYRGKDEAIFSDWPLKPEVVKAAEKAFEEWLQEKHYEQEHVKEYKGYIPDKYKEYRNEKNTFYDWAQKPGVVEQGEKDFEQWLQKIETQKHKFFKPQVQQQSDKPEDHKPSITPGKDPSS